MAKGRNETCSVNHSLADCAALPEPYYSVCASPQGLTCRVSRTMTVKPGFLGTAVPHYDVQVWKGKKEGGKILICGHVFTYNIFIEWN